MISFLFSKFSIHQNHLEVLLRCRDLWDFPGGPGVKNLPCNAGLIPGWELRSPCASGQLNLLVTTREKPRVLQQSHMLQLRPDGAIHK